MFKKLAVAVILCAVSAISLHAQGARRDGLALSTFGPYIRPIPGSSIRVCQSGSTGTGNCTPLQTIYSNYALTTPISGSIVTPNSAGSYTYYVTAGTVVDEVVSGVGVTTTKNTNIQIGNSGGTGTVTNVAISDLSPLFTTSVANPTTSAAATFSLSNAAAYTVFGRCSGSTGAPSYCSLVNAMMPAPGSTNSVITNVSNLFASSTDFTFDPAAFAVNVKRSGTVSIQLIGAAVGGEIIFGSGTYPYIQQQTAWQFTANTSQDIQIGTNGNLQNMIIDGTNLGTMWLGRASQEGTIKLNDGNSGAGVFAGPLLMAGFDLPEANRTATVGSLYLYSGGGRGTTLWAKESGSGNTGWHLLGPVIQSCGTAAGGSSATCGETDISATAKVVVGKVALSSGTPSTAAITSMPAFTGTDTYACTVTENTDATKNLFKTVNVSATAFTITGPDTLTDVVSYICVGN